MSLVELVHLGILEHMRSWMSGDAHSLKLVKKWRSDSVRIEDTVQNICVEYNVRRGLKKKEDSDPIPVIIDFLNRQDFSCGFDGKRRICIELSEMLAKNDLFAKPARTKVLGNNNKATQAHWLSGASKLVWFWAPEKWTMYDNLAALGIKAQGKNTVENDGLKPKHFESFYEKVEGAEFGYFCEELRNEDALAYLKLRPERVFDKLLYLKGLMHGFSRKSNGKERANHNIAKMRFEDFRERVRTFESLLLGDQRDAVQELANASSKILEGKLK